MASRFGNKTYSRPQRACQASIQFDQVFGETNKPSTAKSTGTLLRWGKTSFTSIRNAQVNGRKEVATVKRPKLDLEDDPFMFETDGDVIDVPRPAATTAPLGTGHKSVVAPIIRRNKFFKSAEAVANRTKADQTEGDVSLREGLTIPLADFGMECVSQDTDSESDAGTFSLLREDPVESIPVEKTVLVTPLRTYSSMRSKAVAVPTENADTKVVKLPEVTENTVVDASSPLHDINFLDNQLDPLASIVNALFDKAETANDCHVDWSSEEMEPVPEVKRVLRSYSMRSGAKRTAPKTVEDSSPLRVDCGLQEYEPQESDTKKSEDVDEVEPNVASLTVHDTEEADVVKPSRPIFGRSRRIFNSPKKADKKALYKHRLWQDEFSNEDTTVKTSTSLADEFEEERIESVPPLTRITSWSSNLEEPVTSLHCSKKTQKLYTVVKNVMQAHQCHESGETQEFNDDIDYLLEGIQEANCVGTRCLSILSLASKCVVPAFRMHLRAHGTLSKVFSALHDAPNDSNLSLCAATVLFILSQDRLNMDLERNSLELMLQLLETDTRHSCSASAVGAGNIKELSKDQLKEFDKNKQKVRDLCLELHNKGQAKHLDLENISAATLAMETLLSLTSRQAGEWFKEELRDLGGLDHIVNTVGECVTYLDEDCLELTESILDKLCKLDRCLRVLENVAFMNTENQSYLIQCKNSRLVVNSIRALRMCERCIYKFCVPENYAKVGPASMLLNCALSILKVLLNITHDNSLGCTKVGEQDGLIDTVLHCVLRMPKYIPAQQRFDLLILALGLLINLMEHCHANRRKMLQTNVCITPTSLRSQRSSLSAVKALVNLFLEHEEAARLEEARTDSLLEGNCEEIDKKAKDDCEGARILTTQSLKEEIEETLTKALQKAGKHMEDSMIAAYVALLLGCLIQDDMDSASKVREHLPNHDFEVMVQILKKFLNFMNLTSVVSNTGVKSIQHVIEILESS